MSFASERQAHLQALVDTHFSATSSASNYTACRTFPQVKAALQAPRDRTDTQDDANALVRLVGLALQDLLQQGLLLQEEVDYWSRIEESTTQRSSYLLQTAPKRLYRLALAILDRLRHLPLEFVAPSGGSRFSFTALRNAVPPPSAAVSVLFPHISAQSQTYPTQIPPSNMDCTNNLCYGSTDSTGKKHIDVWKTFAPGFLAKQEARLKRKALERELKQVAHALGQVANSSHTLSENPSITPQSLNIQVALIAGALHSENNTEQADSLRANLSSLTSILSSSSSRTSSILSSNARPSFWEQVWPRFAAYPLIFYIAARQIHKNQDAIWQALVDAKETARGFFVSWVVEPVSKILDTIRGKGGLSLTGRQSLASDLDSLERMVLDFDREVYKMNDSQLQQVSAKLREGDLSEVLQAWETDIKTPLRSAIRGTLIRTLLIQIQKVKVDVDLAMSGIEAMLQSQQLTFAFVGVAPSLLVLFGLYKWVKNTLRIGTPTASSCSQKVARRRAWLALRSIDTLLASDSEPEQGQASLGYLLLELQTLREYATSNVGRGSGGKLIKKEFLKDVAVLESSVSDKTKVRAVNRIWNSFGSVLALPAMS